MAARLLLPFRLLLALAVSCLAATVSTAPSQRCNHIPGDAGWPGRREWARLNTTVGGRLIATRPLARVCHKTGPFAEYDSSACAALGRAFQEAGAATICPVPGEILNPYWQSESCSPFTPARETCQLGNRPVYSIDVAGPADVQAGLRFATKHNIRLVVRNTGIDYLGGSAGQGALALWTYNLKSTQTLANYRSPSYSGPAVKLGAGIIAGEAYEAVRKAGYRIVAPECGMVGVVGGYVQGGGQSQLVTAYGLAADQVLEWEVVTPQGEYLIATPENNTDLYWALAGGGGGTYGIVLSATFRAFPEGPVAGGQMVVQTKNTTALWEAVRTWYGQGPSFVDNSRNNIQFFVTNETLTILCFTMPDQNASSIGTLLAPFIAELSRLNLPHHLTTADYPTYLDSFIASYGPLPYGSLCPSYPIISSRLIPRATVANPASNQRLVDVFRNITADGTWWIGCSLLSVADGAGSVRPPHPPNAVHPAWREAIAYCNPQTHEPYAWRDKAAVAALRHKLVTEIFPALEAATPRSGVLNEIDPTYQGDWKQGLYGAHYSRLLKIKHRYDPDRVMYGPFAVGADEFYLDREGRLCRA